MYELRGVSKRYTRGKDTINALDGIDLTIGDGDRLVIQGPTGGGKSTLLQMLGGLDKPTAGSIELDGTDLARLSEAKLTKVRSENIGFVFQSFNLIPTLTAQENVETALVPLGVKVKDRRERAAEALKSVGLGERLGHLPAEMSGGQQQRVAIARALVKQPKVLLADEPTGNLDESMRDEIMEVLETMWKEYGLTFIMVTHDSSLAKKAPRVATIRKGKITVKENAGA
ncbi:MULTISPECIES: ABC transporter ATP-binding protein [Streptomyces]|uniref:ABC transporter ATP-binding protein n=2 Tax=Streptomyces avermitilis TaxID=33903 RepID=Q82I38_STRAW|nr:MULTISPECIES: ABC transporter ATP-binding protein [Streptomyces]KUN56514.1 peptide ABC transporter ATP-binding protein [Streptomyces avermitilis]MYS98920.1 ATP-binding cassette domain-containing protein [Streptomyces sp. SID5469]OOV32759.1 peptide ABC transporter ATP-binding protein [Streptomyces avermitilis]BAC71031.1 putative ABC transporter ATP-binding protein [Streptomyces avermitilis MA-4680 = NBRC 14893]BBJ51198.1 ABC transporter ATP-binding protein [Streptomyces avermitilis]